MNQASTTTIPARHTGGFVDNASALPTTPPAPQKQPGRTFDPSYKADICTRYRHRGRASLKIPPLARVAKL